jgi:hypothetical protein
MVSFKINIIKMKQLILDIQDLLKKNWKVILALAIVFYLLYSYADIKNGILDGWIGR